MTDCQVPLKVRVSKIKDEDGFAVSGAVPRGALFPDPLKGVEPGKESMVSLTFSVGGSRILLEARVTGDWLVPCNRCLKVHPAKFEAETEETYPADTDMIDVRAALRELAMLEIPQRSICSEECSLPHDGRDPKEVSAPKPPSPFEALKRLKEGE